MIKLDDTPFLAKDEYTILEAPNEPLINHHRVRYSTKADIFIFKYQNYINEYLKWIQIQSFKLYFDENYYIQCLYIQNINSKNKREILLFSQSLRTNFATCLAFLIDLSNYLKIDIITYEYNKKDNEDMNYFDANIVYGYLNQLERIRNIVFKASSLSGITFEDIFFKTSR